MRIVCGADGCRGGWVVVAKDLDTGEVSWRLCRNARELAYMKPTPQMIAVDIPIGLPDKGARVCDLEARKLLGQPRARSVFPAPIRPLLAATSYDDTRRIRLQAEDKNKRMSKQAWEIVRKVREVDEVLHRAPELQSRMREIHPEVCFYFMAGKQSLQHSKRKKAGREERRRLLEPIFGDWLQAALADRKKLASKEDDVLDAFAALWTAERIVSGTSQTIPPAPPKDTCGLRMEMVY